MLPKWGWWTLAASVLVALIIMLVAYLITRKKINKVRDQYILANEEDVEASAALAREDAGQLLWDLKEKTKNPMPDDLLEYTINTMVRNQYKRMAIVGGSNYEKESFRKLAGATIATKDLDFILMLDHTDLNETFDKCYQSLRIGGMISVMQIKRKDPQAKKLMAYLKTTGIRHDFLKVNKGIILVVK